MSEVIRAVDLKPAVVDQITPEQVDAQMELMKQLCPDKDRFRQMWESAEGDILWLVAELQFPDDSDEWLGFYKQLLRAGSELLPGEDIINRMVILSKECEPCLFNWVLSEQTSGSEPEVPAPELPTEKHEEKFPDRDW